MKISKVDDKKVYALVHKSDKVREKSTSGGAFTAISDYILSKNGVIAGATYSEDMRIVHRLADNTSERNRMRGSKYVQSDMGNIMEKVAEVLESNRYCMFVGTPCQVDALNHYLDVKKIESSHLITCDLICHGVPSPEFTQKYFEELQQKGGKLIDYSFRAKNQGWHRHVEIPVFEEKGKYSQALVRSNILLFCTDYTLRETCYKCQYANCKRCSDITIGDCWGIENVMPQMDDNKGISLVMVNTDKGVEITEAICNDVELVELDLNKMLQPMLVHPVQRPVKRDEFWKYYLKHGYKRTLCKYAEYGVLGRCKYILIMVLRKFGILPYIKRILRR